MVMLTRPTAEKPQSAPALIASHTWRASTAPGFQMVLCCVPYTTPVLPSEPRGGGCAGGPLMGCGSSVRKRWASMLRRRRPRRLEEQTRFGRAHRHHWRAQSGRVWWRLENGERLDDVGRLRVPELRLLHDFCDRALRRVRLLDSSEQRRRACA